MRLPSQRDVRTGRSCGSLLLRSRGRYPGLKKVSLGSVLLQATERRPGLRAPARDPVLPLRVGHRLQDVEPLDPLGVEEHARVEDPLGDHVDAGEGLLGLGVHDPAVDRRPGVGFRLARGGPRQQDQRGGGQAGQERRHAPTLDDRAPPHRHLPLDLAGGPPPGHGRPGNGHGHVSARPGSGRATGGSPRTRAPLRAQRCARCRRRLAGSGRPRPPSRHHAPGRSCRSRTRVARRPA